MTDVRRSGPLMAALIVVTAWTLGTATAAEADFSASTSASQRLSTATLQPPTSPAATPGTCVRTVADVVVVTWTKSASPQVDGYEILRSTAAAGPYTVVGTAQGNGAQTYSDVSLPFLKTFYYQVRGVKADWRTDVTAPVSRTTRTQGCV